MDEQSIFLEALTKPKAAERDAFIAQACQADERLREDVERLLAAHEQATDGDILPGNPPGSEATEDVDWVTQPGTRIGPYTIREQIGSGGMGVVFVAEQTEPVRRKVALKIIKPGMASHDIVARFEAERQALAMMDHPHIARVLDGGTTESGQPYFVMELVQGPPITKYCETHRLSMRERIELFLTICQAVHHAHQKGIIHRDIKPTNLLVPQIDGVAIPKVIDFGVAKAVGAKLTEQTVYTHFSLLVGTPLYMSPEQATPGVIDVDTRSDVYSLGVVLYELLTGGTPFDRETLKRVGLDEMRRIVREQEIQRPSDRITTVNAAAFKTQTVRPLCDSRKLAQTVRGELDWIVMKALEKDRTRRYGTAAALAEDVNKYLQDEPVSARPPSAFYQLKKFSRRHKLRLMLAVTATVAAAVGITGLAVSNAVINKERELATLSFGNGRLSAAELMVDQAKELNRVAGSEDVQTTLFRGALELYESFLRHRGADSDLRAEAAQAYVDVARDSWRLDSDARAVIGGNAIRLYEDLVQQFPSEPRYREQLATFLRGAALAHRNAGHRAEGMRLNQQGLAIVKQLSGDFPAEPKYHSMLADQYGALGSAYADERRLREALENYREAHVEIERFAAATGRAKEDLVGTAPHEQSLGRTLVRLNRFDEAEPILEAACAKHQTWLAQNDGEPRYGFYYMGILPAVARLRYGQSDHVAAEQALLEKIALHERQVIDYPSRRDGLAYAHRYIGCLYARLGRVEDAQQSWKNAKYQFEQSLVDAPNKQVIRRRLADVCAELAALSHATHSSEVEADAMIAQSQTILDSLLSKSEDAKLRIWAAEFLTLGPERNWDADRAIDLVTPLLATENESLKVWESLGMAQYRAGRWEAAIDSLQKARPRDAMATFKQWIAMAMCQWRLGQVDEAQSSYQKAMAQLHVGVWFQPPMHRLAVEASRLLDLDLRNYPDFRPRDLSY